MKVSIIIPYYNVELSLLDKCLASIFYSPQIEEDIEVLVINDGSNIDPSNIIAKYPSIVYFSHENKGLGGARNTGIDNATGEYIMFVDSDDTLVNGALDWIINWSKSDDKSDILTYNYRYCYDASYDFLFEPKNIKQYDIIYFLENINLRSSVWLYLFKRSLFEQSELKFNTHIFHEDELFTPQLLVHASSISISDTIVYNYYIRQNSITRTSDRQHIMKRIDNMKFIINELYTLTMRDEKFQHLTRKVRQLSFDWIASIIYNKMPNEKLHESIQWLKDRNLYPIYVKKSGYIFKVLYMLCNNSTGLLLLRIILPLIQKVKPVF